MLLIHIRQRGDKICVISIHINGLGRPEHAVDGRDSALQSAGRDYGARLG